MNRFADASDFIGYVKVWNGGTNGLAERQSHFANLAIGRMGEVIAAPVKPPPDPISVSTPTSQPSAWAAFFMAIAKLFGRA